MKTNLLTICFMCLGFIASAQDSFKLMLAESDAKFAQGAYIEAYKDYSLLYRDEAFARHADTLRLRLQRTRTAIDSMKTHLQATIDRANARQRSYEESSLAYAVQQEKLRWLENNKGAKPENFYNSDVTQLNLSGFGLVQLHEKIRDYSNLETIDLTNNPLLDSVQIYSLLKEFSYLNEIKFDKSLITKTGWNDFIPQKQDELKKLTDGLISTTQNIKNIMYDAYKQYTIGNYSTTLGFYEMINAITPKHKEYLKQLEDIVFETVEYSIEQMKVGQQKALDIQQNTDIVTFDRAAKNINPNFGTCRNFTDEDFLKVDSLDFSGFGLIEVPSQIAKCRNLLYINLFVNNELDLKQVDSILQTSPTAKGLMLYLTDWDSVPQSLKSRIIGIKWQNNLLPIETSDFWQQQQLIYLSINGRDNTIGRIWSHNSSLFHKVMQFTELKYLKIINDRIKEIPASISQLTNLLELDLSNNLLESLPPEIGLLNNLIVLDLSDNRLSKLPPEIGNLKNLIRLELINNEISKLPPDIGKLSNLKELYLGPKNLSEKVFFSDGSYNNIETLPNEIGNLSKLSILNLHGNKIISLPRETGKLTNLKEFDLQENEGLDMVSVFSAFADFPKDIIYAVNPYELGYDSDSSLLLKIPPKFESYPKLNAKLWREFGSNLSTTEQYMLMITCYNKAVEVESDSALNWQLLINTYQTLLDYGEENYRDTLTYCYQKAINHFEKEIKRKKQNSEYLWYNLGQIYYYKEEYEKAIDCFEKSYNLNPKYLENCVSLGEAYINNKDYVNALKYWKLTVEKEVKVRYYWHQLGYCYEMINKVDSAIICYQKAIKLEPENARTTWINLGGIYIDKKEYDKAIYHYEKALAIDSISNDAASIFLNISLCYLYTKQYQKAEIAAQKALAINKEEKYAFLSLARAYLCQGKYAQAEELFLKMKNEQIIETETGAQATLRQLQTMLDAGVIPPEYIEDTKKIMNLMKE